MMHRFVLVVAMIVAAGVVLAGCAQPASAPAPTKAPAEPTKAVAAAPAQPTTAPAKPTAAPAPPTAAPAPKVDYPTKGKAISLIVPFAAGGGADIAARLLAAPLEKELGTPIQILNKAGASTQLAMTELVQAKPDGYTLGETAFAAIFVTYLDPERKAPYTRKDFAPIANFTTLDIGIYVRSDSPYKTLKDMVDAAKAKPETIKMATSGIMSNGHLVPLQFEQAAGIRFAYVHFNGSPEQIAAVLGGHVDTATGGAAEMQMFNSGQFRMLGVATDVQKKFFPPRQTFEAQGYPAVRIAYSLGLSAPANTPREIVNTLSAAVKRAMDSSEFKSKMGDAGMVPDFMDAAQYDAYWGRYETQMKPLIDLGKR